MPRKSWTAKDERQYAHVRSSELERGRSEERAEEIAARTVNKRRREEGRTERRTTAGTGNPRRRLEERTTQELRNRARQLHIRGAAEMDKDQLVRAVRRRG